MVPFAAFGSLFGACSCLGCARGFWDRDMKAESKRATSQGRPVVPDTTAASLARGRAVSRLELGHQFAVGPAQAVLDPDAGAPAERALRVGRVDA